MGLFGAGTNLGRRATAIVTGRVTSVERRVNTLTSQVPFAHRRIATLPGELDVVAPVEALDAAPPGAHLAIAEVWLVGTAVEERPRRPGRLRSACSAAKVTSGPRRDPS